MPACTVVRPRRTGPAPTVCSLKGRWKCRNQLVGQALVATGAVDVPFAVNVLFRRRHSSNVAVRPRPWTCQTRFQGSPHPALSDSTTTCKLSLQASVGIGGGIGSDGGVTPDDGGTLCCTGVIGGTNGGDGMLGAHSTWVSGSVSSTRDVIV